MEKWTLDQPAAFNFFSSSSSSSFLFFFASLHFSPRASSSSSFAPSTSPASSSSRCLGGACVGTFPPFGSHRRASPQAGESQQASQSERWKESKRSEAVGPRRPALLSRTTREKNAIIPGGVRYRSHLDRLRQLSCSFFWRSEAIFVLCFGRSAIECFQGLGRNRQWRASGRGAATAARLLLALSFLLSGVRFSTGVSLFFFCVSLPISFDGRRDNHSSFYLDRALSLGAPLK